jgi:polyisoprenoid-binding protein YceI
MAMYSEAGAATRSAWQIDPRRAHVKFSSKHMMFTTIKGHFKGVRGIIVLDEADPVYSSVEVEIDTFNLYSGVQYRDDYLKSPDFLDVEKYPTITFKSTRVELMGSDRALVVGDLTIHGIAHEVVLDTRLTERGKGPSGQEAIEFEARTSINRKDFGLTWNMALEADGFLVSDTIKIEIAVEALKQSL